MPRYKKPYTLYKRGKYWYYRTYDTNGVRTSATSTGQTSKGAAEVYCNQLFKDGLLYDGSGKRFADYAQGFYNEGSIFIVDRIKPMSKGTIYGYQTILESKLMPYFGKKKLNEIKLTDLKEFRQKLLADGQGASYVNSVFYCLRNIIEMAVADGYIINNPFTMFKVLPRSTATKEAFTLDQIKDMYKKLPPDHAKLIILMALTGMRLGEANGVQEKDFLEKDGVTYIHLCQQYDFREREYIPLKRKTDKDYRDIPVIPELKEYLCLYRGKSIQNHVRDYVRLCCPNQNLSVHSLRHFFVSDTKMKNLNPIKIELVAGHSLKGIEGVYTHFDPVQFPELLDWQRETLEYILK